MGTKKKKKKKSGHSLGNTTRTPTRNPYLTSVFCQNVLNDRPDIDKDMYVNFTADSTPGAVVSGVNAAMMMLMMMMI